MTNLSRTQNLIYGLGLAIGLLNKMRHGAATFEFVGIEHFDETFEIIKAIAENNVYEESNKARVASITLEQSWEHKFAACERDLAQLMEAATALINRVDFESVDSASEWDVREFPEWQGFLMTVAAVELIKDVKGGKL